MPIQRKKTPFNPAFEASEDRRHQSYASRQQKRGADRSRQDDAHDFIAHNGRLRVLGSSLLGSPRRLHFIDDFARGTSAVGEAVRDAAQTGNDVSHE